MSRALLGYAHQSAPPELELSPLGSRAAFRTPCDRRGPRTLAPASVVALEQAMIPGDEATRRRRDADFNPEQLMHGSKTSCARAGPGLMTLPTAARCGARTIPAPDTPCAMGVSRAQYGRLGSVDAPLYGFPAWGLRVSPSPTQTLHFIELYAISGGLVPHVLGASLPSVLHTKDSFR